MPGKRLDWRRAVSTKEEVRTWPKITSSEANDDVAFLSEVSEFRKQETKAAFAQQGAAVRVKNSKLKRLWREEASDLEVHIHDILTEPAFAKMNFERCVFDDLGARGFLSRRAKFRIVMKRAEGMNLLKRAGPYGITQTLVISSDRLEIIGREMADLRRILHDAGSQC